MIKNTAIVLLVTVSLTACSSKPIYKEAETDGYGFSENELSNDRYRVHFKMPGDDAQQASEFAIRRAAELTLLEGMQWFIVVKSITEIEREVAVPIATSPPGSTTTRECDLLGCATTVHQPAGTMTVTSYNESEEVDAYIEVVMGTGEMPDAESVYDAKNIVGHVIEQ